ncbi:MAG: fibronectin type III domain-containing protein [Kiritimatiellae bacterium]|nr:fibronectin type III domain-containing protein [Kiritimatiellia bacterium]
MLRLSVSAAVFLPWLAAAAPLNVHISWNAPDDAASSMVVAWQTLANTASEVEYGLASTNYTATASSLPVFSAACQRYIHAVKLTNLVANTRYYYRCGNGTDGWSGEGAFLTGLPVGNTADFRFVAAGDSRTDTARVANTTAAKTLIADKDPRFLVFTGDVVREGPYQSSADYADSNWDMWFAIYDDLLPDLPFFNATGNHEYPGLSDVYTDQFHWPTNAQGNDRWYSFTFGNAHIVALEVTSSGYEVPPGSDQYNWVQADLSQASTDPDIGWIFVFFHSPPYAESYHSRNVSALSTLCPLFDQYGVDIVFNGHNHIYERSKKIRNRVTADEIMEDGPDYSDAVEGVVYVTTGRAGAASHTPEPAPYTAFAANPLHCVVLDIDNSNSVCVARACDTDYNVIDIFSITKTNTNACLVSPGEENSAAELRQSVIDANNEAGPATIYLAAGLYELKQAGTGENAAVTGDLDILEDLVISGAGADSTIIDGADLDTIFHVIAGTGAVSVTIADLTLRNGSPGTGTDGLGGCLRNDGGTVTLTRVNVLEGLARQGGGIYSLNGTLVLQHSMIASNVASAGTSGQGGGIFFQATTDKKLQLFDSVLLANRATDDGGGIENFEGTVEIVRSTLSGNVSGDDGGGIENDNHNTGGFLTIACSAFVGNLALNGGGVDNDGLLTAVNTTFCGNQATNAVQEGWGSGAIRNSEDTVAGVKVALTNCTVYGNQAVVDGSLVLNPGDIANISLEASEIRMQNTILGTCLSHIEAGQNGTFVSLGNNVIEDSSGCQLSLESGASPDIAGDPHVAALADDGTAGHAHLPLLAGSPAIDAADPAVAPAADQLGQARVDGDGDLGVEPDIGAFEFLASPDIPPAPPVGFKVWPDFGP